MATTFKAEPTLTDHSQTTVLDVGVRQPHTQDDAAVLMNTGHADDDVGRFLEFLVQDIDRQPNRLQSVDVGLVQRIQTLVGRVEVNLDATLSTNDE